MHACVMLVTSAESVGKPVTTFVAVEQERSMLSPLLLMESKPEGAVCACMSKTNKLLRAAIEERSSKPIFICWLTSAMLIYHYTSSVAELEGWQSLLVSVAFEPTGHDPSPRHKD
jgi:hypothetical protein